ncbi:MAG: hypothetical protein N2Z58_08345 [Fervidobacterium sp.]|nr:hypothetical protein [Fervidobacterium sp.]
MRINILLLIGTSKLKLKIRSGKLSEYQQEKYLPGKQERQKVAVCLVHGKKKSNRQFTSTKKEITRLMFHMIMMYKLLLRNFKVNFQIVKTKRGTKNVSLPYW